MFRIAICDDCHEVCHDIEKILLKYQSISQLKLDIEVFYSGKELQKALQSAFEFDLIYLDIEMDDLNGLDLSKEIRERYSDFQTEIVFISGTTQYDRLLFDVQPLHFIPKPIEEKLVIRDLDLALRRRKGDYRKFTFKIRQKTVCLNLNDILYFESSNRQLTVYTTSNQYTYYGTLKDVLVQLPKCFCKIHNSYIINMHQVEAFRRTDVTMTNGTHLPIGDNYKRAYLEHQKREIFGETD